MMTRLCERLAIARISLFQIWKEILFHWSLSLFLLYEQVVWHQYSSCYSGHMINMIPRLKPNISPAFSTLLRSVTWIINSIAVAKKFCISLFHRIHPTSLCLNYNTLLRIRNFEPRFWIYSWLHFHVEKIYHIEMFVDDILLWMICIFKYSDFYIILFLKLYY